MKRHLECQIEAASFGFGYNNPIISMGSCFANRMGTRLSQAGFSIINNPFGTLYHPMPMARLLTQAINAQQLTDWCPISQAPGIYKSYLAHGNLWANTPQALTQKGNNALSEINQQARQQNPIWLITLGTAWAFCLKDNNFIVANCHKQPANLFERNLSDPTQLEDQLANLFGEMNSLNPTAKVVLTVSPVIHKRDGLWQNNVSKGVLQWVAWQLIQRFKFVDYFPAFELLRDDLRDYRYYSADMLHPSEEATEYIWQQFAQKYINPTDRQIMGQVNKIRKRLAHRSLLPDAPNTQAEVMAQIDALPNSVNKSIFD